MIPRYLRQRRTAAILMLVVVFLMVLPPTNKPTHDDNDVAVGGGGGGVNENAKSSRSVTSSFRGTTHAKITSKQTYYDSSGTNASNASFSPEDAVISILQNTTAFTYQVFSNRSSVIAEDSAIRVNLNNTFSLYQSFLNETNRNKTIPEDNVIHDFANTTAHQYWRIQNETNRNKAFPEDSAIRMFLNQTANFVQDYHQQWETSAHADNMSDNMTGILPLIHDNNETLSNQTQMEATHNGDANETGTATTKVLPTLDNETNVTLEAITNFAGTPPVRSNNTDYNATNRTQLRNDSNET